jgi:hypothetical protein
MASAIPVVVIAYNNLTFVKSYVKQLQRITKKIIIFDNKSTYPPMHSYYEEIEHELGEQIEIRRQSSNRGHDVWKQEMHTLPPLFVISDPDLELNPAMPDDSIDQLYTISNIYSKRRVGLALDISEPDKLIKHPNYFANQSIVNWEKQFWTRPIQNSLYELYYAEIDTTFCLINTQFPEDGHPGIRVAGSFTCKHLPWYENYIRDNVPADELAHFRQGNRSSTILRVL